LKRVRRGGAYYRICGPDWEHADDTSYAKGAGGRWNPRGEFGALYLNAGIEAAFANARRFIESRFGATATPEDVEPAFLPQLQEFSVASARFVDAVSLEGRTLLGLSDYAPGAGHEACLAVARSAYADGERGIASLSAVAPDHEELAIFDTFATALAKIHGSRKQFTEWYSPHVTSVPSTSAKRRRR
jgi:hypothetical protein